MAHNESLTTEEISKILKVSKLTVYDLIKKGKLPSYRVGRQIRVDRNVLDNYRNQGAQKEGSPLGKTEQNIRSIIISGQDNSLDSLARRIEARNSNIRPLRSYVGSLNSLIAMYNGKADVVSTHLFDGDTSEYNIPYIRKLLVNHSFTVMHLLTRKAGLFVPKGNPKAIKSWHDLSDPLITIINREIGSGARILLDEQLRLHDINRADINGYENEVTSHIAVASKVANNEVDIGIGTWHAAKMANIDFIPMIDESYDLVILKSKENEKLIEDIRQILQADDFKMELQSFGYGIGRIGEVLYEQ